MHSDRIAELAALREALRTPAYFQKSLDEKIQMHRRLDELELTSSAP